MPIEDVEDGIGSLGLGVEPFSREFNFGNLAARFNGRQRSIKNVLLDQTIIAGIGNIYACEILFASRLNPFRSAGTLSRPELIRLVRATRRVLGEAIARGGSSISDYVHLDGESGGMQDRFKVYGREGEQCLRCKDVVGREVLVGRSTYWCPSCQA